MQAIRQNSQFLGFASRKWALANMAQMGIPPQLMFPQRPPLVPPMYPGGMGRGNMRGGFMNPGMDEMSELFASECAVLCLLCAPFGMREWHVRWPTLSPDL